MNALLFQLLGWEAESPRWIVWEWLAIAFVAGLAALEWRRRDALAAFLSPQMQRRLAARASAARTAARLAFVLLALLGCIGALMRPQAHGQTEIVEGKRVADVMFVLDVSKSMLAEDAAPNRLARAKAEIDQFVSRLENHRVGLVVFAGRAVQACPLTPDRSFFSTVLASVDTRSAGRGGTRVGEAIKTALRGMPKEEGAKVIVLITDGDDQDPYTKEAAQLARHDGVKIVAIGLGSEQGSTITLTDPQSGAKTTLMYEGKPVISKLDGKTLREVALETGGVYVPAGTSAVDLDSIMEAHKDVLVAGGMHEIPAERYPWLVLGALACLLAALWIGAGAGERRIA